MTRLTAIILLLLAPLARAEDRHPIDGAAGVLERVRPLVEEACGAKFPVAPRVKVLAEEAAILVFRADLEAEIARMYPGTTPGQRRSVLEAAARSSVASCVARYSTTLRAVVLVRSGFDRQVKRLGKGGADLLAATIAHETVHALDDARFDFGKLHAAAEGREAGRALSMVLEGRAVFFGRRVAEKLGLPKEVRDLRPAGEGMRGEFLRLTYEGGARFVEAVVERGGEALADQAIREPPKLTHFVLKPARWPDGKIDPRPEKILAKAYPDARREPLSELGLRARYAAADGAEAAEGLFAEYRGGVQAVVGGTNAVVLAFATEKAAEAYLDRAKRDAPGRCAGEVVVRAAGAEPEEVLARLVEALDEADGTGTGR